MLPFVEQSEADICNHYYTCWKKYEAFAFPRPQLPIIKIKNLSAASSTWNCFFTKGMPKNTSKNNKGKVHVINATQSSNSNLFHWPLDCTMPNAKPPDNIMLDNIDNNHFHAAGLVSESLGSPFSGLYLSSGSNSSIAPPLKVIII